MKLVSSLPSPAVPLVGPDGRLVPAWFQFFMSLFARTGGAPGIAASDTQADTAAGTPVADLAPVYAMIHLAEATAAQAMATGPLIDRIAELEARIDALGQPASMPSDIEVQLAGGSPVPAGYLADGDAIGNTNPNTGKFTSLTASSMTATSVSADSVSAGDLELSPATTTASPSAGAAGALPATPSGYATISINGTAHKIPYY